MNRMRWLLAVLVTACPGIVMAQEGLGDKPGKEYRALPFDGNLAAILRDQLLETKGLEGLQDLLNEIRKDPEKYKDLVKNKDLLKQGDGSALDPATRDWLEKWVKSSGKLKLDPEQLKAMEFALKKKREERAKQQPKPDPERESGSKGDPPQQPSPPAPPKRDRAEEFFTSALKNIGKSRFGGLNSSAAKSPAFQEFMTRLKRQSAARDINKGDSNEALQKAASNLKPDLGPHKITLSNLHVPKLPSGGLPLPPEARPNLGGLGGSAPLAIPSTAAGGGLLLLQIVMVLGVGVLVAMVVWRLLNRAPARQPAVMLAGLGPWPLDPARVSTRQQLVQAFEYLALLLLGKEALTANHRDIAGSLGATPDRSQAADELATLYEKARYDPAPGELPPHELAAARRDLCLLAGLSPTANANR
jgi:hypothetical protein